jgi:hypothetical protein
MQEQQFENFGACREVKFHRARSLKRSRVRPSSSSDFRSGSRPCKKSNARRRRRKFFSTIVPRGGNMLLHACENAISKNDVLCILPTRDFSHSLGHSRRYCHVRGMSDCIVQSRTWGRGVRKRCRRNRIHPLRMMPPSGPGLMGNLAEAADSSTEPGRGSRFIRELYEKLSLLGS